MCLSRSCIPQQQEVSSTVLYRKHMISCPNKTSFAICLALLFLTCWKYGQRFIIFINGYYYSGKGIIFCVRYVLFRWDLIVRFVDIGANWWPSLLKLSFHNFIFIKQNQFWKCFALQTATTIMTTSLFRRIHFGNVVAGVLALSVVDHWFHTYTRSGQTKDYKISICCFFAKHTYIIKEQEQIKWLNRNQDTVF